MSTVDPATNDDNPEEQERSDFWMKAGVALVIGGVAANVFGFKYSKWAVGKELHRAWEHYGSHAGSAASSGRPAAGGWRPFSGSQTSGTQSRRSRTAGSASRTSASFTRGSDMFEEFVRQAQETAEEMRRQEQRASSASQSQNTSGGYRHSSRSQGQSRTDNRGGTRSSFRVGGFRVDIDPQMMDDIFNEMRKGRASTFQRGPFLDEEFLRRVEEVLRAADRGSTGFGARRPGQSQGFEEVDWESFFGGASQSSQQGARSQQRTQTGNPFSGAGAGFGSRADGALRTLGLQRGASDAEVRSAYRKEAFKWHPDKYSGDDPAGAAQKFREVTDAYNALRNT